MVKYLFNKIYFYIYLSIFIYKHLDKITDINQLNSKNNERIMIDIDQMNNH